jgi:Pilus formation protein N terminal region
MSRRILIAALVAVSFAAAAPGARAKDMSVAIDQAEAIHLPADAKGVVVGNSSIIGVSVQNNRLLFVTGRSYGATNMIVVGEGGRTLYRSRVTVVADERNAVLMNRGGWTVRYDCAPECRRRPDISEDPNQFNQTTEQITKRAGQAKGE